MSEQRLRVLREGEMTRGTIVYWMQRDQRIQDNWAFHAAQEIALAREAPLVVVFCLSPAFLGAQPRTYHFMLEGLRDVMHEALRIRIPFILLEGNPGETLPGLLEELGTSALITDFNPLRLILQWKEEVMKGWSGPVFEVDTHNIIPAWKASGKQEFSARTIRPRIRHLLPDYLTEIPPARIHPYTAGTMTFGSNLERTLSRIRTETGPNGSVPFRPGFRVALGLLEEFIRRKLRWYPEDRNDPSKDALSNLSPYLHFGQIAPQRVALEVQKAGGPGAEVYLEELIVRRELADNFCLYQANYDSYRGFPAWSRKTLEEHWHDARPYLYSMDDLEQARTHDPLWNVAQREMVATGKMHGYLRMLWAKKILEWSRNPEEAMETAVYLNDKYSLDGRDPNGYAGIAWSIGGVHDRPWFNRPVFGAVRYMSSEACQRKFDVGKYIITHNA